MHLDEGITRFKCATIAEAEMAADAGAPDVLLRISRSAPTWRGSSVSCRRFRRRGSPRWWMTRRWSMRCPRPRSPAGVTLDLFLDLDGGMHRSGIAPGPGAVDLYRWLSTRPGLRAAGLHMYDGHVKATDVDARRRASDDAFAHVETMRQAIRRPGSTCRPSWSGARRRFRSTRSAPASSAARGRRSSGMPATARRCRISRSCRRPLLLTRVVSRPAANRLCLDLGHKAVAAENPHPRVVLFGLEDATAVGHSEEHLVLETDRAGDFPVGTAVYGVPWHVCPTVALYNEAVVGLAGPTAAGRTAPRNGR